MMANHIIHPLIMRYGKNGHIRGEYIKAETYREDLKMVLFNYHFKTIIQQNLMQSLT